MIAREIVTKMENLGCSFLSDEEESKQNLEQKWKILDKESAIEKVYQDLNSDDRGGVENMEMEDFNKNTRGDEVMLLSLQAGGVGLNLVGANHLFLLDMHWNPQQEAQACDRVYRVGQKKEVKSHR